MKRHLLKTWPAYFQALLDGTKTFEIRKNDRDFEVGDLLDLHEYDPEKDILTGRAAATRVTYLTHFPAGLRDGYVAMGFGEVGQTRPALDLTVSIRDPDVGP